MRRPTVAVLVLIATLTACSKKATDPTGGTPPPPAPGLVATQPPARTSGALYDGAIWAQFDRPLDPRTVTTLNVFLKLDAQRIPVVVTYEAAAQRVHLAPTVTLELQRTYTVEFSTALKSAAGTPIAPGVFFQFTTNSLRRVPYDYPAVTDVEGPHVTLGWNGAVGPTNNVFFEIYASTDSLAVAQRTAPLLQRSVFTRFVPGAAWPLGTRVYWAITNENETTRERLDGPVTSFQTLDPSTPIDSVTIYPKDCGSIDNFRRQTCTTANLPCGALANGSIHWAIALQGSLRFASASVELTAQDPFAGTIPVAKPTLWMAQNDWSPCTIVTPGPPFNELTGNLGTATAVSPTVADITSDRLAALLEALYRGRTLLFGTLIRTSQDITFDSQNVSDPALKPHAIIRFYRISPAPAP